MSVRRVLLCTCLVVVAACAGQSGGALQTTPDAATTSDGGVADSSLPPVDQDAQVIFDPCTTNPQTGYDPVAKGLTACCSDVGASHCVPRPEIQKGLFDQLRACEGGDYACMPDNIIQAGGTFRPATCTSSLGNLAGACISKCIPLLADNPQAFLLQRDGCLASELCVPCINPIDQTHTGACELIELLCAVGPDAGTPDAGTVACPYTGPPLLDPGTFPGCAPACGGAHCVPASLVPAAQQTLLQGCTAEGGGAGFCAPDKLIETAGNYVPATCESIGGSEGRCLSTCIPDIAQKAALLPRSTCAADEKCAPCYDPTSTDPNASTGACNLACDKPTEPPLVLTCPYTGPALIDPATLPSCAPACGGAHCVPGLIVPADLQGLLKTCPGGFCAPDALIKSGGNSLSKTCTSVAGAEGRCQSKCIPLVAEQAAFLPRDVCGSDEACVPCFDPTSANPHEPTGACNIACDEPKKPPVEITCPWTGPDIIDPKVFGQCGPACGGAHCVPADRIPEELRPLLATCTGGYCAPDKLVAAGGAKPPAACRSIAGVEGRCLSQCLPDIAEKIGLLPRDTCDGGELCAPCYDPTASDPTAPTGACTIACDEAAEPPPTIDCPYTGPPIIEPTLFPPCSPACAGSRCVPADMIPVDQRDLLATCTGGYCAPEKLIETLGNFVPKSCKSVAGSEGRCLTTCLPDVAAKANILPRDVCETNERCVPCFDPTSADPREATGACELACDAPKRPPVILTCPWTGPNVIDPSTFPQCCAGAHCVPGSLIPADSRDLLASCGNGGFCAPDAIIATNDNWVPPTCRSVAGVEGRCLSTCLPDVASQPLLPQSTCGAGNKCVPCYDPTSGSPTAATGACDLACDKPKEAPVVLDCPWEGPAVINPNSLPACAPACGGAHCLPASFVPDDQQDLLAPCPGGFCAPDDIIATGGNVQPESCTSIAGAEGRCLSDCLPAVSEQPLLPQGTCPAHQKCVPCYDPTSGDPTAATGACSLSTCDMPTKPPVIVECPWEGPAVIDPDLLGECSPTCGGAHCLPAAYVPEDQKDLLKPCTGGYCTPDKFIESAGQGVPKSCRSIAGVEGRCLSQCLAPVQDQPLLPRDDCDADERCVPCYDPTSGEPTLATGACSINTCDAPLEAPIELNCPWTGPPVLNPAVLPACGPACDGAHCLPASFVPADQQELLAPCTGGFCTPDTFIKTGGELDPVNCTAYAGTGIPGRCLSSCIPLVAANASQLEAPAECSAGEKCVPCFDPITGEDMGACGAIGCDQPPPAQPVTFPRCCPVNGTPSGTCVPKFLVPDDQESNLHGPPDCPATPGDVYLCAPTDHLPGHTPRTCTFGFPPLGYTGTCISDCILDTSLIPAGTCGSGGWSCVPD